MHHFITLLPLLLWGGPAKILSLSMISIDTMLLYYDYVYQQKVQVLTTSEIEFVLSPSFAMHRESTIRWAGFAWHSENGEFPDRLGTLFFPNSDLGNPKFQTSVWRCNAIAP